MTRQTLVPVFALSAHGHPGLAVTVGQRITRDTPDDYLGWLVLYSPPRAGPARCRHHAKVQLLRLVPEDPLS